MAQIGSLVIDLIAETASFNSNIQKASATLNGEAAKMRRSMENVQASASSLASVAKAAGAAALGMVSLGTAMAAGRQFLEFADQSKQMAAQLKLATAELGSYGQAQRDVNRIATESRVGLDATTKLYGNMLRASEPLGKTQADAARATETFAKTLKLGGASAEEASSATLQFGQALASGVLRGDEFNSIAEASPRLLQLLADAMGVPKGELRNLAAEGKLTSDVLYRALTDKRFTDKIDTEFRQLPVTFDEAMGQIHDAAVVTFGAFDQGGEFSSMLSRFVTGGAADFRAFAGEAETLAIDIRATFAGLENVFDPLVDGATSAFGGIKTQAMSVRDQIAEILSAYDAANNVLTAIENAPRRGLNALGRGINEAQRRAGAGPNAQYFGQIPLVEKSDTAGDFLRGYDATASQLRNNAIDRQMQSFLGGYDALGNPRGVKGAAVVPASSATGGTGGKSSGKKDDGTAKAARDAAAAVRELDQALAQVVGQFDPARKAAQDYADTLGQIDKLVAAGRLSSTDALGLKITAGRQASQQQQDIEKNNLKDMLGYDVGGGDAPGDKLFDAWRQTEDRQRELAQSSQEEAKRFKTSWEDASQGTLRALDQLSYGLQSGNFLDILSGVIDLLMQLGSLGVFGSKIQTNIKGARASGGPVSAGGTYLVGEKGPELFTPSSSGSIVANDNLTALTRREGASLASSAGMRADRAMAAVQPVARVEVVPSPYFDAVTRGNAAQVAAPMATQAGLAGASLAETRIRRKSANRIP